MRATYLSDLIVQENYLITGDKLHHLTNVVRVEAGERLLLLNGAGLRVLTQITAVTKKNMSLRYEEHSEALREIEIDLALGMPKREALESCLKQATELGIRKIFLIKSRYSQMRFPDEARTQSLLVSALEQANNPFMPEVMETSFEALPWDDYGTALWLNSQTSEPKNTELKKNKQALLIVGPEGGFSPEEMEFFRQKTVIESLGLPTPILRTTTAVSAGVGILLERLMK